MKTGAIQAGIARLVARLTGPRAAADPDPDGRVRARRHDAIGMAEESLAFYVAGHHGHDRGRLRRARRRASLLLLGCGIGVHRLDDQPVRDRHRLRVRRRVASTTGSSAGSSSWWSARRSASGWSCATPTKVKADPSASLVAARRRANEAALPGCTGESGGSAAPMTGRQKVVLVPVLPGLRGDDRRRHPMGGPRHHADPDPVVVVPGDDRLVPAVLDPHRGRGADGRGPSFTTHVRRRRPRPARRRADHRHRPRRHRRS